MLYTQHGKYTNVRKTKDYLSQYSKPLNVQDNLLGTVLISYNPIMLKIFYTFNYSIFTSP